MNCDPTEAEIQAMASQIRAERPERWEQSVAARVVSAERKAVARAVRPSFYMQRVCKLDDCAKPFVPSSYRHDYCSPACKALDWYRRNS